MRAIDVDPGLAGIGVVVAPAALSVLPLQQPVDGRPQTRIMTMVQLAQHLEVLEDAVT